jgi:diguanylate cyclase (GGDEF)-like protein/PAS domain S-box-containing protein
MRQAEGGESAENLQEAFRGIQEVISGDRSMFALEYPCHSRERERWFLLRVTPLAGEFRGAVTAHIDITERKRIEQELERNRHLLARTQEIAHLGSWELDLRSNRLYWSDEVYRIFGLRPQEFEATYEAFLRMVHPEDRAAVDAAYSGSLRENRDTYGIEHRIVRGETGEVRHVSEKCEHERDGQGRIVRSVGMVHDITERKRIEQELKKEQEQLQAILDTANSGIILVDAEGRIQFANNTMARMLGCELNEVIGSSYLDHVYEPESEEALAKMRQLLHGDVDSVDLERLYKRCDGTTFWGNLTGSRLYYPDGSFWALVGVITDITERKNAEEALRQSEENIRTTLHSIGDAVIVTDTNGCITRMNPVAEQLVACSFEDGRGKPLSRVFHILDTQTRRRSENPVEKVLKSGEIHGLGNDTTLVAKDGREYQIADSGSPVRDDKGNITGVVLVFRNVTEEYTASLLTRKRLELLEYASSHSESELLTKALDEAGDCVASPIGFFHFVHSDQKTLSLQQWSTRTLKEFCYAEGQGQHYSVDQAGVWVDCLRQGKPVIHNDYHSLPHRRGLPQGHARVDRELVVPVVRDSRIRAFMGVGNKPLDYTQKDVEIVSYFADVTWELVQSKRTEEKLRYMSFHDSLTGLYNRNFFEEELERLQDSRYSPVGIVVCDLDGLKFINDTLGHDSGDELLSNTADILRRGFRSSDIIARIGGDEFAVLITRADQRNAERIVARLRRYVDEFNASDPKMFISLSIGYAVSRPGETDMQELLREADNRMYREKMQREKSSRSYMVQALMKALEARDFLTEGHSDRLQQLVVSLGRHLGLTEDTINDLRLLARFHDLGKVGISDSILFKPGPLDEEEKQAMRKHCEIGQRIARSVPDLAPIADWILKHHEWWDGNGYPLGLQGEEIPLPCRILAIADAFDAMTKDRPYRGAMSHESAVRELEDKAGTQFDPELVDLFVGLWK